MEVDWPPTGAQGPAWLSSNARIAATWVAGNGTADGVRMLPASDTGGLSGLAFDARDGSSTHHEIVLSGVQSTLLVDSSNTTLDVEANTTHTLASIAESRINATGDGIRVTEIVGEHRDAIG